MYAINPPRRRHYDGHAIKSKLADDYALKEECGAVGYLNYVCDKFPTCTRILHIIVELLVIKVPCYLS